MERRRKRGLHREGTRGDGLTSPTPNPARRKVGGLPQPPVARANVLVWRMDRLGAAAYMLSVAREATRRADDLQRLGNRATLADIAKVQIEHERQFGALAAMLSYCVSGGLPVDDHPPPRMWERLRIAWDVLRG